MPIESLRDRLISLLEPCESIRLAVLFGSHARGEANETSDVDLGFVLEDDAPGDFLFRLEGRIGSELSTEVDTVDLRKAPALLRFEISRDGVLLVEREKGAWTGFQVRAWTDWWDWQPTFRRMGEIARESLRKEIDRGSA